MGLIPTYFLSYKEYILTHKNNTVLEQLVGDSKALDRALAGEELSYNDGIELMNYDNLHLLGAVALEKN